MLRLTAVGFALELSAGGRADPTARLIADERIVEYAVARMRPSMHYEHRQGQASWSQLGTPQWS